MREIQLSKFEDSAMRRLRDSRPAILLGSLISTFAPTNLPSGEQISRHVFSRLFPESSGSTTRSWPPWLWRDYKNVPFEGVWACHPNSDAVVDAIVSMYSHPNAVANEFHDKIAEALGNGTVSAVITTNYDLALERSKQASNIHVVECERDLNGPAGTLTTGVYFKIHGSAKPELKDSIVFRLEQEGSLHPWKKRLLHSLLENRTLLVIGYSGRDFDICPRMAAADALSELFWLARPESKVSPNALSVLESRKGTLIRGDFGDLMSRLLGAVSAGVIKCDVGSLPGDLFGPQYDPVWRIRILEHLRCYNLCRPLVDREPEFARKSLFDVYVGLLGHHGKYGRAAKENLRKSNQYARGSTEWIWYRIAASGSRLGQWKHMRAIWQYLQAWAALKYRLKHQTFRDRRKKETLRVCIQALRQTLTLAMRADQFGFLGRGEFRDYLIKKCLRKPYESASRLGRNVGTLEEIQWIEVNAERLGLPRGSSQLLRSRQGLANLGLQGSAMIPLRDEVRDGPWDITGKRLRETRLALITALRYGLLHETWKISWLLAWRGPESCKSRHLADWLSGFSGTEYGVPYRVFMLYRALGPRRGKKAYCLMRAFYGILLWSKARLRALLPERPKSFHNLKTGSTTAA